MAKRKMREMVLMSDEVSGKLEVLLHFCRSINFALCTLLLLSEKYTHTKLKISDLCLTLAISFFQNTLKNIGYLTSISSTPLKLKVDASPCRVPFTHLQVI